MKLRKVDVYDAGYGGTIKKAVAATAAAAAMVGGLTGCFKNSLSGDTEYRPTEYDGYMTVESVSDSDLPDESSSPSSDEEMFTLDGDVAYMPSEQD